MLRKFAIFLSFLVLVGCTTVNIPNYIQDKNPYKKTFYANFDKTSENVETVLSDLGWKVKDKADPGVFQQSKTIEGAAVKQILLFTEIRQTSLFIATTYSRVNIYLRELEPNSTEVEIRYVVVTSTPIKTFYNYRKDFLANRFFKQLEEKLK